MKTKNRPKHIKDYKNLLSLKEKRAYLKGYYNAIRLYNILSTAALHGLYSFGYPAKTPSDFSKMVRTLFDRLGRPNEKH